MVLSSLTWVGSFKFTGHMRGEFHPGAMFKIGQKSLLQRSFTRAAHAQVHEFEPDYIIIPDIIKTR